jgi:porphobilinogen synthase
MSDWPKYDMDFLAGRRQRRLRRTGWMRDMVRETQLTPADFILPIFVEDGVNRRTAIRTMPGVERVSVDLAVEVAKAAAAEGVPALAIFPNTQDERRNENGSEAYNPDNLTARTLRAIKDAGVPIGLITDVALDEYSSDGQDGLVRDGEILNDETVEVMVQAALMQAAAGADIVAPSDMMDGRVAAIRAGLDAAGFPQVAIMSYAAKYCSAFYGPFREAADSAPAFGDRRSHQMDPANSDEALREVELDIDEGADIVMVKPALTYLDVIRRVKDAFGLPTAAYHVSGEYAMLKAAARNGWIDEPRAMIETLTAIRRAGADIIITYYARDAARLL